MPDAKATVPGARTGTEKLTDGAWGQHGQDERGADAFGLPVAVSDLALDVAELHAGPTSACDPSYKRPATSRTNLSVDDCRAEVRVETNLSTGRIQRQHDWRVAVDELDCRTGAGVSQY